MSAKKIVESVKEAIPSASTLLGGAKPKPQTNTKAYLYRHHDSRGGSYLIQASSQAKADEMFMKAFAGGDGELTDDDREMYGHLPEEDGEGSVNVVTYGAPLPAGGTNANQGTELLWAFDGHFVDAILDKGSSKTVYLVAVPKGYDAEPRDSKPRWATRYVPWTGW